MKKSELTKLIKEELGYKHNQLILDTIQKLQDTINILKKDKTADKAIISKLWTNAKPITSALHKLMY